MSEEAAAIEDDGIVFDNDPPPGEEVATPESSPEEIEAKNLPEEKEGENLPEKTEGDAAPVAEKTADEIAAENEAIRQQAYEAREAKRQAKAQKEAEERAEAQRQQQPAQYADVPPPPDPYSDDYDQLVAERDRIIAQNAAAERDQLFLQQQQEAQYRKLQEEQQAKNEAMVASYNERITKLGVDKLELHKAASNIELMGISEEVFGRLMKDERGPELVTYLGNNLAELQKMNAMEPIDAAVYLATTIKPKAQRPPPVLTPPPVETPSGGGVTENEGYLQGVTFE